MKSKFIRARKIKFYETQKRRFNDSITEEVEFELGLERTVRISRCGEGHLNNIMTKGTDDRNVAFISYSDLLAVTQV